MAAEETVAEEIVAKEMEVTAAFLGVDAFSYPPET
jgi:hypothetical protein